jgi:hypothetical protein
MVTSEMAEAAGVAARVLTIDGVWSTLGIPPLPREPEREPY